MSKPKGEVLQIDTLLKIGVTFYNVDLNLPADPFQTQLFVMDPNGNVTEIASNQIVRNGLGLYYSLFMPSSPGQWFAKWKGSGPTSVQATCPDIPFFIKASPLIPS